MNVIISTAAKKGQTVLFEANNRLTKSHYLLIMHPLDIPKLSVNLFYAFS